MSDAGNDDDLDPFAGLPPILGDLARMMQRQGPMNWETAHQFAASIATEGESEPNVDPAQRFELEQLSRVAELQIANATGLPVSATGSGVSIVPVTRAQWARRALDDYRPVFDALTSSMDAEAATAASPDALEPGDPLGWMAPLMQMLGPALFSLTAGSMVGHLAQRAVGHYELPLPRPKNDELLIVSTSLDSFGEDWSLPLTDLRLWVCLRDICHHAVLNVEHVRSTLDGLILEYVANFDDGAADLDGLLGGFDPADPSSLSGIQSSLGDPEILLGAVQSEHQRAMQPRLEALVTTIVGYVDWVMDEIGGSLIAAYDQVTEAMRRRRVEASQADRLVERIFGLELTQVQFDRGEAFARGVVERAGSHQLARLWTDARFLPTPAEVDAPGLWLARIELPES